MSSTPEGQVKQYLRERISALGGKVRFIKWIGRRNCPDCYVMFKNRPPVFVETKAPGKRPRPAQEREIADLREHGVNVIVCPSKEAIDEHFPL